MKTNLSQAQQDSLRYFVTKENEIPSSYVNSIRSLVRKGLIKETYGSSLGLKYEDEGYFYVREEITEMGAKEWETIK